MNKYIKPEFMLTSLTGNVMTGTNCSIQKDDREMIESFLTEFGDAAFLSVEGCKTSMDNILGSYCKFTAGELGATQVFFS